LQRLCVSATVFGVPSLFLKRRAAHTLTFAARFQLVAAMNPCPCGFLLGGEQQSFIPAPASPRPAFVNVRDQNVAGESARDQNVAEAAEQTPSAAPSAVACTCTAPEIRRYLSKISGPLLDRIDICIEVHGLPARARELALPGEDSRTVRARVVATRARQARRGPKLNAKLRGRALRDACKITEATQKSIEEAKAQFSFSQSRTDSLLRVARTIADMVGSEAVEKWHFEEAVNYRPFDRKIFA
jgi:magnesium chelatase family protein